MPAAELGTKTQAERRTWEQHKSQGEEPSRRGPKRGHLRTSPPGQAAPCGAPTGNELQSRDPDEHTGLRCEAGVGAGQGGQHRAGGSRGQCLSSSPVLVLQPMNKGLVSKCVYSCARA